MEVRRFRSAVVVLSSVLAFLMAPALLRAKQGSSDGGQRNENSLLTYLVPTLSSTGKGAVVYYRTECDMRKARWWDPVPFPQVNVQPPSRGASGLAAVREIFRSDENVVVTEEPSGIIRIRIGNVRGRILRTRIQYLKLSPLAQDLPKWTIFRIENAKDLRSAMHRLNAEFAPFSPGLVSLMGPRGVRHLPSALKNVTLEQVLDLTAKTFKGIAIYGACTKPSGGAIFRLDFVDVPRPADGTSNGG